jgi:hypothetical protein
VGRRERPAGGEGRIPCRCHIERAVAATLGHDDNDSMPVDEAFGLIARRSR